MRNGESFKDWLTNRFLFVSNYINHNIFCKKVGRHTFFPGYWLIFEDNFKTHNKHRWNLGRYFGPIHPGFPYDYSADEAVEFTREGLLLNTYFNERMTDYYDGNIYRTVSDFGMLTSKRGYGYGLYEWDVVVPFGKEQWFALWLSGVNSWPPEIDVVEGYSNINEMYKSNLQTNIHYGNNGEDIMIRGRKMLIFREANMYKPQNYKLLWTKDKIEIFLNGYKVRVITDKNKLDYFKNQKMYIIMNNKFSDRYAELDENERGSFLVKKFKYYKVINDPKILKLLRG